MGYPERQQVSVSVKPAWLVFCESPYTELLVPL
jgi:hypothetical protein